MKYSLYFLKIFFILLLLSSCNNSSEKPETSEVNSNPKENASNTDIPKEDIESPFIGKWKQEVTANIAGASANAGLEFIFNKNGTYSSKVSAMGNVVTNTGKWKMKNENELELSQNGELISLTSSADKTVLTNEAEGIVLQKQ